MLRYYFITDDFLKAFLFPLGFCVDNASEVIHSGYFYSASSSPLLLRTLPTTAFILCQS